MRYLALLLLLVLTPFGRAFATHIVGGEFELTYLNGNTYSLTLNLYFDAVNGNPAAEDSIVDASIFGKTQQVEFDLFELPKVSRTLVPYTNIDCTVGSLTTWKIVYSSTIVLDPFMYSEPAGYYVVWQRCCRNQTISNLIDPGSQGQTFYMEFPPILVNGQPFINSSPQLFPPLSDYACVGSVFYYDFSGTDRDGDSLAYSLVSPLQGGSTFDPNPPGNFAAPYDPVIWSSPYSATSQILGPLPLQINALTGQLKVMPGSLGLFVFGVKCDEYRNGIKIGEVRRDFQLLVLNCPVNEKPKVLLKEPGQPGFYQEGVVVQVNSSSTRCFDIFLTDPDSPENLQVLVKPVNFTGLQPTLSLTGGTVQNQPGQDTLRVQLCLPKCMNSNGQPFLLDVIVKDDGCSLPKQDTVRFSFVVAPAPNQIPVISSPVNLEIVKLGLPETFTVTGTDADADPVQLQMSGIGFNPAAYGMQFSVQSGPGSAQGQFSWTPDCRALDRDTFLLVFKANDLQQCQLSSNDSLVVKLILQYDNLPPLVSTSLGTANVASSPVGQPLDIVVFGTDPDSSLVTLTAYGDGFNLADYGISFTSRSGVGSVQSPLTWTPNCQAITQGSDLRVFLVATDASCPPGTTDTTEVLLRALYQNEPPELSLSGVEGNLPGTATDSVLQVMLFSTLKFTLSGLDADSNLLQLSGKGKDFDLTRYGMRFTDTTGTGTVQSGFEWTPDCSLDGATSVRLNFTLSEQTCLPATPRQRTVRIEVVQPEVKPFSPPNVVTPNQDGKNDYFELDNDLVNLPPDNCQDRFGTIKIFSRWGNEVYRNKDRSFRWTPVNVPDGIYFYLIEYEKQTYKGWVQVLN